MSLSKCNALVKKAVATSSAIEVYNKPSFEYREETFSILMINAWELLLKAAHPTAKRQQIEFDPAL